MKVCYAFSSGNQRNDLTDVEYCTLNGPKEYVNRLEN